MRSKNFILVVLLVLLSFNFVFIFDATAYSNDWGSSKNTMALNLESYRAMYYSSLVNGKRMYFGTHDWLAESALIILRDNSGDLDAQAMAFINLLYSDTRDLKMYFLLGTEIPDAILSEHELIISIYNCKGEKLDGRSIINIMKRGGKIDYEDHHIYLTNTGTPIDPEHSVLPAAQRYWVLATQYLIEGDCQMAALFLGMMTHYIADAGYFPHLYTTATYNDLVGEEISKARPLKGTIDNPLKRRITKLTCRAERDRGALFANDFFSIQTARTTFAPAVGNMGYFAALCTAMYTQQYSDEFIVNTATHMTVKDYAPIGENWWCDPSNLDSLLDLRNKQLEDLSASNPAKYAYFKQLEAVLNEIILQCCNAINLAATFYTDCDCGGGNEKKLEKLQELTNTNTMQYTKISVISLSLANLMASLMLISLILKSSKDELVPILKL